MATWTTRGVRWRPKIHDVSGGDLNYTWWNFKTWTTSGLIWRPEIHEMLGGDLNYITCKMETWTPWGGRRRPELGGGTNGRWKEGFLRFGSCRDFWNPNIEYGDLKKPRCKMWTTEIWTPWEMWKVMETTSTLLPPPPPEGYGAGMSQEIPILCTHGSSLCCICCWCTIMPAAFVPTEAHGPPSVRCINANTVSLIRSCVHCIITSCAVNCCCSRRNVFLTIGILVI